MKETALYIMMMNVFISIWFWSTFYANTYIYIYMWKKCFYVKQHVIFWFLNNNMPGKFYQTTGMHPQQQANSCMTCCTTHGDCGMFGWHSMRIHPLLLPKVCRHPSKRYPQLRRLHHATFPSAPVFLVTNFIWEKATSKPRASSLTCFSLSLPQ